MLRLLGTICLTLGFSIIFYCVYSSPFLWSYIKWNEYFGLVQSVSFIQHGWVSAMKWAPDHPAIFAQHHPVVSSANLHRTLFFPSDPKHYSSPSFALPPSLSRALHNLTPNPTLPVDPRALLLFLLLASSSEPREAFAVICYSRQ